MSSKTTVALLVSAFSLFSSAAYSGISPRDMLTLEPSEQNLPVVKQVGPPKRYIVKFRDQALQVQGKANNLKVDASAQRLAQHSALTSAGFDSSVRIIRNTATGAVVVEGNLKPGMSVQAMSGSALKSGDIEYIEEDRILKPMAVPSDPRYSSQWHYFESTGGMNLPAAWDQSTGEGVVVAVLDTGYRPHVDLVNNLVAGYDMISDDFVGNDGNGRDSDARDPGDAVAAGECGGGQPTQAQGSSWHGTHVAGTVAAEANNGEGVVGVAYNARVQPVRVLGKCGGYTSDIADGMIWAAGGSVSGVPANATPAQVLNLSLGGGGSCDRTTQDAIDIARSLGATVVVAAGNSNDDASGYSPASCNGVITVAAINRNGGRAYYSNYGSSVEIAAPGGDVRGGSSNGILSTLNSGSDAPAGDSYAWYQGTSMAAPHVAGLVALLYSADPAIGPDQVLSVLQSTARSFPASCSGCGAGITDAAAAVNNVLGGDNSGGGTDAECPAGYELFSGTVEADGTARLLDSGYYYSASRGEHAMKNIGESLTMQLYKWSSRRWQLQRSSTTELSYTSNAGYFYPFLRGTAGQSYDVCLKRP